jgi:hypothetical protein
LAAAVVNAVTTIPFAVLMERTSKRKPWMFWQSDFVSSQMPY